MVASATITLKGLGQRTMNELANIAKRTGLTPEGYLRQLVLRDLAFDRKVRSTTLADLMGPGRKVDEAELDRMVEEARTRRVRSRRQTRI